MNLNELISTENIEQDLVYMRQGVKTLAHPKNDCTIAKDNEIEQLSDIPGKFYFYGQILGEIVTATGTAKAGLKKRIADVHLKTLDGSPKMRVSDLEGFINKDDGVVQLRQQIANLEGAESKVSLILTALKLKQEALIEINRKRSQELKAINKLT